MKENLLLLKYLLEHSKIRFTNTWQFCQKNVYFNVLDDIVNKYNNKYHRTTRVKPIDVKSDSYAEFNVDSNDKDPKFKVGNHVKISKYKYIFAKGYLIAAKSDLASLKFK